MPAVAAAAGKGLALVMIPIEATRFDVEDALDVAAGRWWAVAAHAERAARRGQKRTN